jgi:hypothetical protein
VCFSTHYLLLTQLFEKLSNTKIQICMISLTKQFFNCFYNVIQITDRIIHFYFYTKYMKLKETILNEFIMQATFQMCLEHHTSHKKYVFLHLIINTIIWTTRTFKSTTFDDCVTKQFFNREYNVTHTVRIISFYLYNHYIKH